MIADFKLSSASFSRGSDMRTAILVIEKQKEREPGTRVFSNELRKKFYHTVMSIG